MMVPFSVIANFTLLPVPLLIVVPLETMEPRHAPVGGSKNPAFTATSHPYCSAVVRTTSLVSVKLCDAFASKLHPLEVGTTETYPRGFATVASLPNVVPRTINCTLKLAFTDTVRAVAFGTCTEKSGPNFAAGVGEEVGTFVGLSVGEAVGFVVGEFEGLAVGELVGVAVAGAPLGDAVFFLFVLFVGEPVTSAIDATIQVPSKATKSSFLLLLVAVTMMNVAAAAIVFQ